MTFSLAFYVDASYKNIKILLKEKQMKQKIKRIANVLLTISALMVIVACSGDESAELKIGVKEIKVNGDIIDKDTATPFNLGISDLQNSVTNFLDSAMVEIGGVSFDLLKVPAEDVDYKAVTIDDDMKIEIIFEGGVMIGTADAVEINIDSVKVEDKDEKLVYEEALGGGATEAAGNLTITLTEDMLLDGGNFDATVEINSTDGVLDGIEVTFAAGEEEDEE